MSSSVDANKKRKLEDAKTSDAPVLYSYWRSSCSWRVRLALAFKGIKYDYRAIHLVKDGGQQLKPEYTSLNPMKAVPTLVIDGLTLANSHSIMEYLEETRPDPPILPRSFAARQKVRQIVDIITSDIQPVQNLRILLKVKDITGGSDAAKLAWGKDWITVGFEALERELVACAGKYCVGDTISMADFCLIPQIYNARRFKVDLTKFPNILRVEKNVNELSFVESAHPSKQPDAQ